MNRDAGEQWARPGGSWGGEDDASALFRLRASPKHSAAHTARCFCCVHMCRATLQLRLSCFDPTALSSSCCHTSLNVEQLFIEHPSRCLSTVDVMGSLVRVGEESSGEVR
jgi:hypothetical protein